MKKRQEKIHENQEKMLDDNELEELRQTQKKLPPYLENISRDIMLNRKLKILLQKSIFLFYINRAYSNRKKELQTSKLNYFRRKRYEVEACNF
jgi:hypothetical protein